MALPEQRYAVLLTLAYVVLSRPAPGKCQPSARQSWFPGDTGKISLVEARCSGTTPLSDTYVSVGFDVTHVFAGTNAKVGDRFWVTADRSGQSFDGDLDFAVPTAGQLALWLVANDHGGLHRVIIQSMPWFGITNEAPNYADAKTLASNLEAYTAMPLDGEPNFLWAGAGSQNDAVVAWSIRMLATQFPKDFCAEAPRTVEGRSSNAQAQVSIDVEMIRLERSAWIASPTRSRMLSGWATTEPSAAVSQAMASHLFTEAQQHLSDDTMLVPTCVEVAFNERIAVADRKMVIGALGVLAGQYHVAGASDALRKVLRASPQPLLRAYAAAQIEGK